MFWIGIFFFVNWIHGYSTGAPDDSWMFALFFLIWGWPSRSAWIDFKKCWQHLLKFIWSRIRYRYVIVVKSDKEVSEFYTPIYEWLEKNVGQKNVWLEYNVAQMISEINRTRNNNPMLILTQEPSIYEFRFKKKKDAMIFKIMWG